MASRSHHRRERLSSIFIACPESLKKRRLTIGVYPAIALAEAHSKYAVAREMVASGIDPGAKALTEKKEERSAPTIAALANEYLEKWAKGIMLPLEARHFEK